MARFKQPNPSHLARKQKIQCNPPVGMKRSKGRTANDPKKVSATDRVKQFSNCVPWKAFCLACREELSNKKIILELHIKSAKHVKGKEALNSKQKSELKH